MMDTDVDITNDGFEENNCDDCSTDNLSDNDGEITIDGDLKSEENIKYISKGLSFLPDHPLHDTHQIFCLHESEGFVPNFIGGFLPRSDCGDREYYCSTMLTLFKPWRNGKDLRTDEQSWDDSFLNHRFSLRQIELMKYFNLKYECLDARDDYAVQLKKGKEQGLIYTFEDDEDDDDDENRGFHHKQDFDGDNFPFDDDEIKIGMNIGRVTNSTIILRNEMHNIMKNSGWFDESPDGPPEYGDLNPIQPEINHTDKEWSNEVKAK